MTEFAMWRWAPTVALIGGTLLYILLVLIAVPSEIGLPGMNTKFVPRSSHASSGSDAGSPFSLGGERETSPASTSTGEHTPPPPVQAAIPPQAAGNFGSRGFSPPLERQEAPAPVPPSPPAAEAPPAPAPEQPPPPAVATTADAPAPVVPEAAPAPTAEPAHVEPQ